jgi:hypothetical protein
MTAPGPIRHRAPISARAPTTASGPISAVGSTRAVGSTTAEGWAPGRGGGTGWNSATTLIQASPGSAHRMAAQPGGTRALALPGTSTAPARVAASASA